MKKAKSKRKSKSKPKSQTPPSKKLGNRYPSAVDNEIALKELSIDQKLIDGLSDEEISRRKKMIHSLYGTGDDGISSDEEEEEEEEEKEQEWTEERMKRYYYSGIHDHSKCVEAEEQRQLQSCYYYKLEAQYDDNLIERLASGPVPLPPCCFPI